MLMGGSKNQQVLVKQKQFLLKVRLKVRNYYIMITQAKMLIILWNNVILFPIISRRTKIKQEYKCGTKIWSCKSESRSVIINLGRRKNTFVTNNLFPSIIFQENHNKTCINRLPYIYKVTLCCIYIYIIFQKKRSMQNKYVVKTHLLKRCSLYKCIGVLLSIPPYLEVMIEKKYLHFIQA